MEENTEQQTQERTIDVNNLTVEEALNILTNTVQNIPLTYDDHVRCEQARQLIIGAINSAAQTG